MVLRLFFFAAFLFVTAPHNAYAQNLASQAARAADRGDWQNARDLVMRSRDPAAGSVYEWMLYTDRKVEGLPFLRVADFIKRHPQWPQKNAMLAAAEKAMDESISSDQALAWFQSFPPVTILGLQKYIWAAQKSGDNTLAQRVLNELWPSVDGDTEDQGKFLSIYGRAISQDSHRRRLDDLLFNDRVTQARALAQSLGNGYPELVAARVALASQAAGVEGLIARIPSSLKNDPGLLFERLKFRRKNDDDAGALSILNNPPSSSMLTNPEDWWKERNILARRLIEKRDFAGAYKVASNHQQMDGQEYADAEWLSGWLALRFLNRPQDALEHFESMGARVKTAISRARAYYWTGRSYEVMGDSEKARANFQAAANFPKTYYGQLAQKHMKGAADISPTPAKATEQDRAAIKNSEMFRAAMILHDADLRGDRNQILKALAESLTTGGQFKALAQELLRRDLPAEALKVAKIASGQNFFLSEEAYPQVAQLTRGLNVDTALAHALIRQESQFDAAAESPAGALGLMQLMPSTAREVARKRGWQYDKNWLVNNPRYNVQLGSAYLNDVLKRFDNSYPLALASYNAGPGRVNQWISEMGDPRSGKYDWVDWIEMIPVYETRNYVQRVMENYIVYRDHLNVR